MNRNIKHRHKSELVGILEQLIIVIKLMRKENEKYILQQNEREAQDWLNYLKLHNDKEELLSLKKEVVDRLFHKYDVIVEDSKLDKKRVFLMNEFIKKAHVYLK